VCRVDTDAAARTQARLWLCRASGTVLANLLGILGVSAPERMDRVEGAT
jgi:arginyl-tRNA synthetase